MSKLNIKATTTDMVKSAVSTAMVEFGKSQKSLGVATVYIARGCLDLLKDKSSKASAPNPLQVLDIKKLKELLGVEGKQATLDRIITVVNKLYKAVQDTNRSKNPYTVTLKQLDKLLLKLEIIDSEGNVLKIQSEINEALKPKKEKAEKSESETDTETETEGPEVVLGLDETADAIAQLMQSKCGENFNIVELLDGVIEKVTKSDSYQVQKVA